MGTSVGGGEASGAAATPFVCLENLVSQEMLTDDNEYTEVVDDIKDECAKSGDVVAMVVPRPPAEGAGKCFVHYADVAAAIKAVGDLNNRQFDGNMVKASYISEAQFPKVET